MLILYNYINSIYIYDPSPCSFIFLYVHHLPCQGSKAGTVMCGVLGVRLRPEEDLTVNHSSEEFPMLTGMKHQEQQKHTKTANV